MRKAIYLLIFVLALALAYAISQTSSPNSGTSQAPAQSQTGNTPGQTPSSAGATQTTPDTQNSLGGNDATSGAELQSQIQNALRNEPTLANDNVNVSVSESEIDLSGTVANAKAKTTAKRIAQSYAGNRKVKEHLTVSGGQDNVSNPTRNNENPASSPDTSSKPAGEKPPQKQ